MVKNVVTIILLLVLIIACKKTSVSNSNPISLIGIWKGKFSYSFPIQEPVQITWHVKKDDTFILVTNSQNDTGTWKIQNNIFIGTWGPQKQVVAKAPINADILKGNWNNQTQGYNGTFEIYKQLQ